MGRKPCCDKEGLKKGPWLPEEDQMLTDYIQKHGPGNWRSLPKKAGLQRCGKSCRLRWTNYLRPDIKRGRFSFEEEETIIQLHSLLGNKWSAIAAKLPGRTDNEIKNYWNTHIRKRLLRMGIDPVTHTRRLDLLDLPSLLNSNLQNSSQFNLLKLLSLQSLVSPELLRLASLLSTNQNDESQIQNQNMDFVSQNLQANQLNSSAEMKNQYNQFAQTSNHFQVPIEQHSIHTSSEMTPTACTSSPAPVFEASQTMLQSLNQCNRTDFSNFDTQNFGAQAGYLLNDQWQSNFLLNSETAAQHCNNNEVQTNDRQYISEFTDLLKTSDIQSDNSIKSTPCTSQQTPLSSNSEHLNSSSSSEDAIDSYCQNLLNFDMPVDLFNVC